jgi:chromosome segregation ATPase
LTRQRATDVGVFETAKTEHADRVAALEAAVACLQHEAKEQAEAAASARAEATQRSVEVKAVDGQLQHALQRLAESEKNAADACAAQEGMKAAVAEMRAARDSSKAEAQSHAQRAVALEAQRDELAEVASAARAAASRRNDEAHAAEDRLQEALRRLTELEKTVADANAKQESMTALIVELRAAHDAVTTGAQTAAQRTADLEEELRTRDEELAAIQDRLRNVDEAAKAQRDDAARDADELRSARDDALASAAEHERRAIDLAEQVARLTDELQNLKDQRDSLLKFAVESATPEVSPQPTPRQTNPTAPDHASVSDGIMGLDSQMRMSPLPGGQSNEDLTASIATASGAFNIDLSATRLRHVNPASGELDAQAYYGEVFDGLRLLQRPLRFTVETTSALVIAGRPVGNVTKRLVTERGGYKVYADDGKGIAEAIVQAERDGYVFGELIAITNVADNVIKGLVSFQIKNRN